MPVLEEAVSSTDCDSCISKDQRRHHINISKNKLFASDSDENRTSPSSRADSAPVEMRSISEDGILSTLREIELICNQLRDVQPTSPHKCVTVTEAINRPSLISTRSTVRTFYCKNSTIYVTDLCNSLSNSPRAVFEPLRL